MSKVVKIEYILILSSLIIFCSNTIIKNKSSNNYETATHIISDIQLHNKIPENITQIFYPYTYFSQETKELLNQVINEVATASETGNYSKVIDLTIEFQNLLGLKQRKLMFAYDCLLYCSILLAVIGIFVILQKNYISKSESIRREAISDTQIKFSRDLHDGVAQDLAALKIYLKKNDDEKSDFYADQAFKEVRYLIDSLHLDFNGSFEDLLKETVRSFSSNYEIETNFFWASNSLNNVKPDIQLEVLRIFQEALSNIARHANATAVTIKITDVGSDTNIIIHDNGTGFNIEEINNSSDEKHHYGLTNIKERVTALGGKVEFINSEGTIIAITFKNLIH